MLAKMLRKRAVPGTALCWCLMYAYRVIQGPCWYGGRSGQDWRVQGTNAWEAGKYVLDKGLNNFDVRDFSGFSEQAKMSVFPLRRHGS